MGEGLTVEVAGRLAAGEGAGAHPSGTGPMDQANHDRPWDAATERLAFLAEASTALAGSLDFNATLASIARLAVPYLADWCNVDVVEPDGYIHRLATVHADPAKQPLCDRLKARYPRLAVDARHTLLGVFRTRQAWMDPDVSPVRLAAQARDAEHLELIRGLGFASEIVVPLVARERVLGTITLVRDDASPGYTAQDLELAEELARRVALALDNARLHRELREQVEAQMRLNAELREVAAARDRAVVELERALRTRDDFLGAAAHDLKTPLAIIKGQAQLMRRRAARASAPVEAFWAQGLASIEGSASKMAAMVDELLDLTRLQFGESLLLERRPTDLVGLARQAAAERQQTTGRHTLRVEASCSELIGDWDPARLERTLNNLLDNAIKYSPAGGEVLLSIAEAADSGGCWAVVAVRDRGIGIPAADLPRLFDRFHRAENVIGRISGTGIGLAMVRHTVESHDGSISVESEEHVGSTFTVRLPLKPAGSEDGR